MPRHCSRTDPTSRTTDGSTVIKSCQGPDAAQRCAREATVLSALAGRLPAPPVLDREDACLRLGLLPGVHGQELIDSGMAPPVLDACGRMLDACTPTRNLRGTPRDCAQQLAGFCCTAIRAGRTSCSIRRPVTLPRCWTGSGRTPVTG